MLAAIIAFVMGLPRWISLGALASIFMTGAYLVHDYSARGEEIVALKDQLRIAKSDQKVVETSLEVAKGNIKELNDLMRVKQGDLQQTCSILQEIVTSADPADKTPVGGIIARTLKRLKEIRGE